MRLKGVLILTLGLALVGLALLGRVYWWGNSQPKATVVLTLPPTPTEALTVEGLHPPAIKPEWKAKMRAYEERAQWLDTPTWMTETVEVNGEKTNMAFWQVPFVSTGVWDEAKVTLRDGQQFNLDVLYALQIDIVREVILVPVVMGVGYQDEYLAWTEPLAPSQTGAAFLEKVRREYPLGQLFFAYAEAPWATPQGIDWAHCNSGKAQIPRWSCVLGKAVEAEWPGYTVLVLRRILQREQFPQNFFLYGVMPRPFRETWEVSP